MHHRRQPPAEPAPELVSISLDGGRINTRTPGQGVGVQFDRFLAGAESSRILSGFLSGGPANPDAS